MPYMESELQQYFFTSRSCCSVAKKHPAWLFSFISKLRAKLPSTDIFIIASKLMVHFPPPVWYFLGLLLLMLYIWVLSLGISDGDLKSRDPPFSLNKSATTYFGCIYKNLFFISAIVLGFCLMKGLSFFELPCRKIYRTGTFPSWK